MNIDNKYIKNENIKIRNFFKLPNAETYNGSCSLYNFKNQTNNFEKFKDKIAKYNIVPTEMYSAYW